MTGLVWVEITYSSPSHECLSLGRNKFPVSETSNPKETNCGGTFVFVGDVISMAYSIQLTSYQPRWTLKFSAYLPNLVERVLIWTFHVSLALALLNSLPVSLKQFLSYVKYCLLLSVNVPFFVPEKKLYIDLGALFGASLITYL